MLLSGCAWVLPVPHFSTKLEAGHVVRRSQAGSITPGRTTRAELEQVLGPPTRECRRSPSAAYSWERRNFDIYWWLGWQGGEWDIGGWHAFFVAFDDQGVVLRRELVSLSNKRSLDDQLERWAKRVRKRAKLKPV